jgi:pimeloyl-ACP methyl ester carboxylesterase
MNALYWKPPFRSPRDDVLVDEILTTVVGPNNYPGDGIVVDGWPGMRPGTRGVLNALSPKYLDLSAFAMIEPRPPVLWVRGDSDAIVSDTSLSELGYLGQIGAVPGWPGPDTFPPQPMVTQTRAVLDAYAANGGYYREEVLPDCGHSPHIEQPDIFNRTLLEFLAQTHEER